MSIAIPARLLERSAGLYRVRAFSLHLAAIALLPVLLSLPFLSEPLGRDQAVYFSVVRSGGLPYVHVFDHKPPLIYGWYALSLLISRGEPSVAVVSLLAAFQLSITALAVAWIGAMLGGRKLALVAGWLMALATTNQYLQFGANTEVFMLPFLTLSLGASIAGVRSRDVRWFCLAGVLGALAASTKPVGILNVGAIACVLAWSAATGQFAAREVRRWITAVLLCAAGVMALVVLPFAASGHLGEFWHANVTYNLAYSGDVPAIVKLFRAGEIEGRLIAGGLYLWMLAGIGVVLVCASRPRAPIALVLAGGLAAFLGAVSTGRQFAHYYAAITPFAALLAGIAVLRMTDGWAALRERKAAQALYGTLAFVALIVVAPPYLAGPTTAFRVTNSAVEADRAVADEAIARYIVSITGRDDRIYNLGRETQLYVLSGRTPAVYYIRSAAFDVEPATFDQTLRALRADPPRLIADTSFVDASELPGSRFVGGEYDLAPEQRRQFAQFLSQHYRFDRTIAHADIYLRTN